MIINKLLNKKILTDFSSFISKLRFNNLPNKLKYFNSNNTNSILNNKNIKVQFGDNYAFETMNDIDFSNFESLL